MQRKHYHVLYGLRGCYRSDLSLIAQSKRQAIAMARNEAKIQNAWYADDHKERRLVRRSSGLYTNDLYSVEISGPCYEECMCDD